MVASRGSSVDAARRLPSARRVPMAPYWRGGQQGHAACFGQSENPAPRQKPSHVKAVYPTFWIRAVLSLPPTSCSITCRFIHHRDSDPSTSQYTARFYHLYATYASPSLLLTFQRLATTSLPYHHWHSEETRMARSVTPPPLSDRKRLLANSVRRRSEVAPLPRARSRSLEVHDVSSSVSRWSQHTPGRMEMSKELNREAKVEVKSGKHS